MGKDDKFKEITEKLFNHMTEFMKIQIEINRSLKDEINELRRK